MSSIALWSFLPLGYLITILIETPILFAGLSRRHRLSDRIVAGLWLTACTYPIVVLVLPALMYGQFSRTQYLTVAETFAPLAECILFWLAYCTTLPLDRRSQWRDFAVVIAANLASFGIGELIHWSGMISG